MTPQKAGANRKAHPANTRAHIQHTRLFFWGIIWAIIWAIIWGINSRGQHHRIRAHAVTIARLTQRYRPR
jgi:hypothetical protein